MLITLLEVTYVGARELSRSNNPTIYRFLNGDFASYRPRTDSNPSLCDHHLTVSLLQTND